MRTPLLLRARTCCIVLSACRGDELENVLSCPWTPFVRLAPSNASFSAFRVYCALFRTVARDGIAALELLMDAKLRRAAVWTGRRSAGVAAMALAAPAMQLHVDDISIAGLGRVGVRWERCSRACRCLETFRDAMTELVARACSGGCPQCGEVLSVSTIVTNISSSLRLR
jgi:hypothetical protein